MLFQFHKDEQTHFPLMPLLFTLQCILGNSWPHLVGQRVKCWPFLRRERDGGISQNADRNEDDQMGEGEGVEQHFPCL